MRAASDDSAVIEYCLSNVDGETRRRLAAREEVPASEAREGSSQERSGCDDVREATCLDHCGRCYREAFLVVDGTVRTGPSHAAVLRDLDR